MRYEVRNAKIMYTELGVACSEHGVLSFIIRLDYGGGGQGYGQICLDAYDKYLQKRAPTILGSSLLLGINDLFGVDWEKLKGLPCRAYQAHTNILALGHYLDDKWLWYDGRHDIFRVTKIDDVQES